VNKLSPFFASVVCCLHLSTFAQGVEPASKEELEELKSVVEGERESAMEYRGYVDALRKIKISGYMQTQFRLTDLNGGTAQFSGGNFPANTNKMFQVRRARLKIAYDNVLTQFVVELDAIQTGVTMKDAYLSVIEPWTQSFGFQMGVFYRPFGYEMSFSSGSRETPEQSRMYQTLFPGERDLGVKLFYSPQIGPFSFLRAELGIFNGSGPASNEFDNFKDVIGQVVTQFPLDELNAAVDLGLSGYLGNVRNATKFLWTNGESAPGTKGFVLDSSATNLGDGAPRRYVGLDVQLYYDVPVLGGLVVRGEYITGRQPGTSTAPTPAGPNGTSQTTISPAAQATGPVYQRDFAGWYVNLVQNIGNDNQVIVKYDVYDPNTFVTATDFVSGNNLSVADIKYSTLGFGFIHHWDGNVKFVFYYEIPKNEKLTSSTIAGTSPLAPFVGDVKDNVFTFRVQYKF